MNLVPSIEVIFFVTVKRAKYGGGNWKDESLPEWTTAMIMTQILEKRRLTNCRFPPPVRRLLEISLTAAFAREEKCKAYF